MVRGGLRSLRTALVRLPLNLRSNRWFVVLGRTLYVFSRRNSLDYAAQVARESLSGGPQAFRVYRSLMRPRKVSEHSHRDTDAILLPNLGRFGNAVREVVSAVVIANALKIGHVYLAGDNVFAKNSDVPSPGIHHTPSGPTVWIGQVPRKSESFTRLILWSRNNYALGSESRTQEWESTRAALSLVAVKAPPRTLTIHIRGGDVFGNRDVRSYGQPPLAYYERVVEHHDPDHVHIVYQDEANPVVRALVALCEARDLSYSLQSGELKDDIQTLMGAHTLVAGRGTFIPAVVGLSPHIKKVYFFEDKFTLQPPRGGFEVVRVYDAVGDYRRSVLESNWENTPEQRSLMLTYPASNLHIEELSKG